MDFSFVLSKAEVASSNNKMGGFFNRALAIHILYFYPPDNYEPIFPTIVSIPLSNFSMKSQALAYFNTVIMSYSVASFLPYCKFSLMVPAKRTGS